eukprot:4085129-Ditylum_brightwellii.AAC.1
MFVRGPSAAAAAAAAQARAARRPRRGKEAGKAGRRGAARAGPCPGCWRKQQPTPRTDRRLRAPRPTAEGGPAQPSPTNHPPTRGGL